MGARRKYWASEAGPSRSSGQAHHGWYTLGVSANDQPHEALGDVEVLRELSIGHLAVAVEATHFFALFGRERLLSAGGTPANGASRRPDGFFCGPAVANSCGDDV